MSSALPLIVFGHVYFLSNSSLVVHNGLNSLPSIEQGLTVPNEVKPAVSQVPPIKRQDYTYTPGIGAHKVHTTVTTWYEARQICKLEGGDLAIINSAAEAELIVGLLKESDKHDKAAGDFALIGFHDLFKDGHYETVNGQSLSDAGYNEWGSEEPNGGNEENCGTISRDGKFNDGVCDVRYGYICELFNPDHGSLPVST